MNEKNIRFFRLVRDFLTVFLGGQKAVSPNTVKSYRESVNLLLNYICERNGIALGKLCFEHLSTEAVEGFLDYLEKTRQSSISTRNQRLACIRSFFKYAGSRDVGLQAYVNELSIPLKKKTKASSPSYFSEAALKTILEQPDTRKKKN